MLKKYIPNFVGGCHAFGDPGLGLKQPTNTPKACRTLKGLMLSRWDPTVLTYCKRAAKAWHPARSGSYLPNVSNTIRNHGNTRMPLTAEKPPDGFDREE